ncbi:MAG: SulP family inorganic anion transporter [Proteobacteria bacterium]|nr:SulP family inorganic anion transporter [Pseudomonadota bacterium]
MITRIFPFLEWFKDYNGSKFKIDFLAGLTVALVLIPQSMAYAQLAGLPAYYGLYAAFLPPMVAALFGSSRQLATGPVAVVSLMTAASLEPLATLGSEAFIGYAVVLALTVGVFQLTLGVLRLGLIVNFLAHPVVNGFSNAAAIIIASSQLSKLFGVDVDSATHHYETIIRVVEAAIDYTHWPTLLIGIFSIAIMVVLKRLNPRIPNVLVAVVVTTLISWGTGFEHNQKVDISQFESGDIREKILAFNTAIDKIAEAGSQRTEVSRNMMALESAHVSGIEKLELQHQLNIIQLEMEKQKLNAHIFREELRSRHFSAVSSGGSGIVLYLKDAAPQGAETDGRIWRIKLGNKHMDEKGILVTGGGSVVGVVPKGLPAFGMPKLKTSVCLQLLPAAVIISLLGFMEAIAIAKAMASKTGQRIDPNQELIGQGLANILGSIGKSYPTSGSFSRSAVNLQSGAVSGLSSVVTSIMVVIALFFFTPLLYHLPQTTLAAVIMMAVIGLVNVSGFVHAWKTQWYDGAISIITFVFTLVFAPHLEKGIYVGVVLSLGMFLYKSMRPKVSSLSRHEDESLREIGANQLSACEYIDLIRFEGPLFFANASYLEDEIDDRIMNRPNLKHIIIAANGINDIDTSGEETLALIVDRLRSSGYGISLSGVNESVMSVLKRTHLYENIGSDNIFPTMEKAIRTVYDQTHRDSQETTCPLLTVCRDMSIIKN